MRSAPHTSRRSFSRLALALLATLPVVGAQAQTYQMKQWVVDLKPTYSVTARWASASVDMGTVALNQTVQQTVALFNDGNLQADFSTLSGSGSGISVDAAQCAAVAPGASCAVNLTFSPMTVGAVSVSNVKPVAVGTVSLQYANTLSATGIGAQGHASLSSASLTYPAQLLGTTSTKQTVTLVNDGTAPLTYSDIRVATGVSDFGQSNTCASVAVNASCAIDVTFTPFAPGARSGNITLTSNGSGLGAITLNGTGQGAALTSDLATQSFGSVMRGSASSKVFTLTNTGNVAGALTFAATPASVVRSGTCSSTLAANASCTVLLTYTPVAAGPVTGTMTVSAPATAVTLGYSGMGLNPAITLTLITPNRVEGMGGLPLLQVLGTNFTASTSVLVDGVQASCTFTSSSLLNCAPPAHAAEGSAAVSVLDTTDGRTATQPNFLAYEKLAITSLSLTSLSTVGGQTLLVTGKGFMPGATATIKGLALSCTVTSTTLLTCVTPAATAGAADLVVTNLNASVVTTASAATFAVPATYAVLDAGRKSSNITLDSSRLKATSSTSSMNAVYGTLPKSSGKYYVEVLNQTAGNMGIGILDSQSAVYTRDVGGLDGGIGYLSTGAIRKGNTVTGSNNPPSAAVGTTIGMAVDLGAKTLRILIKPSAGTCGTLGDIYSFATGLYPTNPAAFLLGVTVSSYGGASSATVNFGQSAFACPVPAGYQAGWY